MLRRGRIAACMLIVAGWTGPVWAQAGAPIQTLRITDWSGELFFNGHYDTRQENQTTRSVDDTDTFGEAGLRLNLDGYLYHPNLVDFFASVSLGRTQQTIDTSGTSRTSDGTLLGYNLSALILKEKQINGRVYANRSQQFITRTFARNIDSVTDVYGAEVNRRGLFPMSLALEYSTVEEQTTLDDSTENTLFARFEIADMRDPDWLTRLVIEHEDSEETITSFTTGVPVDRSIEDTVDSAEITNDYRFGPVEQPHTLSGRIRLVQRGGTFEEDSLLANQQLSLNHSETLSSFYAASYSNRETQNAEETVMFGQAGVRKRFYESLIVSLVGDGRQEEFVDGDTTSYGGEAVIDYTKLTAWGRLNGGLTFDRHYQDESFPGDQRTVLDENVTLNGTVPQQLSQPNVIAGSVNVTDLANTTTYVEGVDYFLQSFGAFTEVVRINGAGIADGQTVLVDYVADASRSASTVTDSLSVRASHRFDQIPTPITIYAEYRFRTEQLAGGTDPGSLDTITRYLIGTSLEAGAFTFIAEYESLEQELAPPFTAERASLSYVDQFGLVTVNAGASYEMRRYQNADQFGLAAGDEYLRTLDAHLNITTRATTHTLIQAEALYRDSDGRTIDESLRLGASVIWSYGKTEVRVSGFHETWEQENSDGDRLFVELGITRRF